MNQKTTKLLKKHARRSGFALKTYIKEYLKLPWTQRHALKNKLRKDLK